MKTVNNKKITLELEQMTPEGVANVPAETTYFELIFACCKRPEEGGYSWDMIEKIGRIKTLFDKAVTQPGADIDVEDADFEFLKERVLTNRTWVTFDLKLLEFKKYLESL